MTLNIQFTEQDWQRLERDWSAWWEGELDRPMVVIRALEFDGIPTVQEIGTWDDPADPSPLKMPVEEILEYHQRRIESARYYGDSWPRWFPNFGPGIVAGFVGSLVKSKPGTVWFEPPVTKPLHDIAVSYDPENLWWRRIKELTRAATAAWGDQVTVAFTDLGGNLDILASLRDTNDLLLDTSDAPDEIERLVDEITKAWLSYYDQLYEIVKQNGRGTSTWAALFSPKRYYMLQSDFAYMISPQMFERFVLPDLDACCSHLDHAFYHLDGKGQIVHLDRLLSIKNLRGIQWIPGAGQPPSEQWMDLLKRIRDGGKLCQIYVSPEGALQITHELGGKGFAFWIMEDLAPEEAEEFLCALRAAEHA